LQDLLIDHGVVIALVCAGLAVVYGALTSRALLALSPGNATMQSLSLAVQEGASAYLRRQYTVIAAVGVVLFIALIFLQDIEVAIGPACPEGRSRMSTSYSLPSAVGALIAPMKRWPRRA